jgi:hypothetical protein
MWSLVFIMFIEGKLQSQLINTYETMYDCFDARETLSFDVGGSEGYFPPDLQAICVFRGEST